MYGGLVICTYNGFSSSTKLVTAINPSLPVANAAVNDKTKASKSRSRKIVSTVVSTKDDVRR